MKSEWRQASKLLISGATLVGDQVHAFLEDTRPHCGRLTIICGGQAWTVAWTSMPCSTVAEFVRRLDVDALVGQLSDQGDIDGHLRPIVQAVQQALPTTPDGASSAQWISAQDRLPTRDDADYAGFIRAALRHSRAWCFVTVEEFLRRYSLGESEGLYTHWLATPPLPIGREMQDSVALAQMT
ncbi:TPA: hypothetical protein SL338_004872 [Pseudomonas aeruginosa]|nr:hypothetical protein [Pseudomonas aeruginosa]